MSIRCSCVVVDMCLLTCGRCSIERRCKRETTQLARLQRCSGSSPQAARRPAHNTRPIPHDHLHETTNINNTTQRAIHRSEARQTRAPHAGRRSQGGMKRRRRCCSSSSSSMQISHATRLSFFIVDSTCSISSHLFFIFVRCPPPFRLHATRTNGRREPPLPCRRRNRSMRRLMV
jgi:hypothetical protein